MNATQPADLAHMAKLGIELRWRLSTNRLRRAGKVTRRLVVAVAATYTTANVVVLGSARYVDDGDAARALVLLMASMALGWVFGPVLVGGVDETIDPTRLALLPLARSERYAVQLAASLTGLGPISASAGLILGLTIGHTTSVVSGLVVPIAAVVAVLLMVGSARTLAAVLAIALRSRVGRDIAVLAAAIAGGTLFTLAQLARDLDDRGAVILDRLEYLPFTWPAQAVNAARADDPLAASVWLIVSLGLTVAVHLAWERLSQFLLVNGERSAQTRRRSGRAVLNGASTRFGATLARQWIYLRRSPNNRVGFAYGTIFGMAFAMVQIVQQGDGSGAAAAFGILLAMLANLGASTNVLGFDAGSLWIEVLADGPGRVHLVARQIVALPNLLLPTWLSGLAVGWWTGEWKLVLLVSLLAVPVAVNVATFGMVASALAPAALPDWDNPFGNRAGNEGRGLRLVVVALAGMTAVVALSTPMIFAAFAGLTRWWVWLTPLGGLACAGSCFAIVTFWAGRYLHGKEPELIELLSPRAFN